ncbi:ATP-binding cassette, subfamily C [Anaerovirgula multivorans]|uniref:ATP-binding cassette, subfamily C n=1 Tax=Anaerovirgula multivorans TaxID=312168 RepID=A0A239H6E5_9FIRM|nr:ABC transporter ATP-binding protein [Anaerovirgula multivorans]SNS76967.1 ATP-binding cassette, subfamily C [Anaerovirgula multivorans]
MRKTGISIMAKLITLVKPFAGIMMITILMGTLGFLAAIGITVVATIGILHILGFFIMEWFPSLYHISFTLLIIAFARGILRYLEQFSGHYIAFKLLAFIRDKVFKTLRRLAPAKVDGRDSGQLISLITSDIEQLEVFYAHTIAPIVIAILTCSILLFIIGYESFVLGFIALLAYITIGFIIPFTTAKATREHGRNYRHEVGDMNSYFLQSLRGIREIILFEDGERRKSIINEKSIQANKSIENLKKHEGRTRAIMEATILSFSTIMLFVGSILCIYGYISFASFLISFITLISSYGPVIALSNLSNNLLQTFASGERVLALLEEEEVIKKVTTGAAVRNTDITLKNVNFAYEDEVILNNLNLELNKNQIIGILGKSGCGKSTLLKLLMRFYDVQEGSIKFGGDSIKYINTSSLRSTIAYVTQSTYLFNSTIEENLRVAKRDATMDEIISASKKANIYDFIMNLPEGFQTQVGELGDNLSSGERQRLGLARAFLHAGKVILLDEPTSNLDSLNENIILKSLKNHSQNKTIILVSHRPSTLSIADKIYHFNSRRVS